MVNAPEIHVDLDEAEYHAHPALSATGMRHLLRSPLHYRYVMDNRKPKHEFDVGHAAHAKILGTGADVIKIPETVLSKSGSINTLAAREFIEDARAEGLIPLKSGVVAEVEHMAEAVLANKKARRLLELPGKTELSLFATDPDSGVDIRGRLDRLTDNHIPIDVKTAASVQRHKVLRSIFDYGYDIQAEAYRHLVRLTMKVFPAPMHLIFVESSAPHEVRVVQLSHPDWIAGGEARMRAAIEIYAECMRTNSWPGEDDADPDVEAIEPTAWYSNEIYPEIEI